MTHQAIQTSEVNQQMAPDLGNQSGDKFPYIHLLGVRVHRVDMETTMNAIREYVHSGKPHIIVTADAFGIVLAQNDEDFLNIVNSADLVTPDGSGILKASKMLGTPLECRVSGVDIAYNMCRMAVEENFSIYLLGAAPGVADAAAEKLQSDFPSLRIAGIQHGYFKPEESAEIVAKIRESGAKVLLAAMGIPRQEKWIRDNLQELGVCVAMGVGGTFDVFSGKVRRAPGWMQRHGLEWAYRLIKDPSKVYKVSELPKFLGLVLKEKYFGGKRG